VRIRLILPRPFVITGSLALPQLGSRGMALFCMILFMMVQARVNEVLDGSRRGHAWNIHTTTPELLVDHAQGARPVLDKRCVRSDDPAEALRILDRQTVVRNPEV